VSTTAGTDPTSGMPHMHFRPRRSNLEQLFMYMPFLEKGRKNGSTT
jgi:hypothetical protein